MGDVIPFPLPMIFYWKRYFAAAAENMRPVGEGCEKVWSEEDGDFIYVYRPGAKEKPDG